MCSCNHVVDFTCNHVYRNAFFHRLNNCVFPTLKHLNHTLSHSNHNHCLLAEDKVVFPFAQLMLQILFPTSNIKLVSLSIGRNRTSKVLITQKHSCQSKAIRAYKNRPRESMLVLGSITEALQREYKQYKWHNILILRKRTRRFTNEHKLFRTLQQHTNTKWIQYDGSQTLKRTVFMFSYAHHILGFHGAGIINAAFSRHAKPHIHEISTFNDTSEQFKWRHYNGQIVKRWNAKVHVTTQFISLKQILTLNPTFQLHKYNLKDIKWIELSAYDINVILDHIVN